jgi:hypothetical protein
MSRLTVPTRLLVGMCKDTFRTASKEPLLTAINSVLLHTDRGEIPLVDEVPPDDEDTADEALIEYGVTDVLVATSTDRKIIAQCFAPCTGQLHQPVLISSAGAKAIYQVFEPLYKTVGKTTHEVVLVLEGGTLVVKENPTRVSNPVSLTLEVLDDDMLDRFPRFESMMQPDPTSEVKRDGKVIAPTFGRGLEPQHLITLGQVAKRRQMPIAWYDYHQLRASQVTIGAWYRAASLPCTERLEDDQLEGPTVPVWGPKWPDRGKSEQPPLVVAS